MTLSQKTQNYSSVSSQFWGPRALDLGILNYLSFMSSIAVRHSLGRLGPTTKRVSKIKQVNTEPKFPDKA